MQTQMQACAYDLEIEYLMSVSLHTDVCLIAVWWMSEDSKKEHAYETLSIW